MSQLLKRKCSKCGEHTLVETYPDGKAYCNKCKASYDKLVRLASQTNPKKQQKSRLVSNNTSATAMPADQKANISQINCAERFDFEIKNFDFDLRSSKIPFMV